MEWAAGYIGSCSLSVFSALKINNLAALWGKQREDVLWQIVILYFRNVLWARSVPSIHPFSFYLDILSNGNILNIQACLPPSFLLVFCHCCGLFWRRFTYETVASFTKLLLKRENVKHAAEFCNRVDTQGSDWINYMPAFYFWRAISQLKGFKEQFLSDFQIIFGFPLPVVLAGFCYEVFGFVKFLGLVQLLE